MVGILALIGLYHLNKTVALVFIVFWFTIPGLMLINGWPTIKRWIKGEAGHESRPRRPRPQ